MIGTQFYPVVLAGSLVISSGGLLAMIGTQFYPVVLAGSLGISSG